MVNLEEAIAGGWDVSVFANVDENTGARFYGWKARNAYVELTSKDDMIHDYRQAITQMLLCIEKIPSQFKPW